jgi:hypothetical protein
MVTASPRGAGCVLPSVRPPGHRGGPGTRSSAPPFPANRRRRLDAGGRRPSSDVHIGDGRLRPRERAVTRSPGRPTGCPLDLARDDREDDLERGNQVDEAEIPTAGAVHDLARAAAVVTGVWWRALEILLVAYSGLRWGEHPALTADRVDPLGRRIGVDRQVSRCATTWCSRHRRTAAVDQRCTPPALRRGWSSQVLSPGGSERFGLMRCCSQRPEERGLGAPTTAATCSPPLPLLQGGRAVGTFAGCAPLSLGRGSGRVRPPGSR